MVDFIKKIFQITVIIIIVGVGGTLLLNLVILPITSEIFKFFGIGFSPYWIITLPFIIVLLIGLYSVIIEPYLLTKEEKEFKKLLKQRLLIYIEMYKNKDYKKNGKKDPKYSYEQKLMRITNHLVNDKNISWSKTPDPKFVEKILKHLKLKDQLLSKKY